MIQSNKNFIPDLANKTKSIRKLLKKNERFRWDKACQKEFEEIKAEFKEDILLKHFNPLLETSIHVDAHQSGISAVLMQQENNQEHIVALASRATTPTEARYPQLDLEALAVDCHCDSRPRQTPKIDDNTPTPGGLPCIIGVW